MTLLPFKDWLNRKPAGRKLRKRIPKVSKKRERENREYSRRRKAYLLAHPNCEAWPVVMQFMPLWVRWPRSVEIHHVFGRGKFLLVEETWLAVSREAHDWIHSHPSQARALGLLK